MKNEIQIFSNPDFGEVRTMVDEAGRPLFCGKDVAIVLGYTNTSKALSDHCRGEVTKRYPIVDSLGRTQKAVFIPESDLYRLIVHSKLPAAEKFERWVFEEVLPSIRKTGSYSVKPMTEYQKRTLAVQTARILRETAKGYQGTTYGQIIDAYVTKELTGEFLLPLPKLEEKTYSATDIGKMFGVSARKIGDLAKTTGLKTEEHGEWFKDKAANCDKEVQTFRYYGSAIPVFEALLGGE